VLNPPSPDRVPRPKSRLMLSEAYGESF